MSARIEIGDEPREARRLRARLARVGVAGDVVLRRASRVRPTFWLDAPLEDDEDARAATALGASPVAWEGRDEWCHWQACFAPLVARPLRGAPDVSRRWILTDEIDAASLPERAELDVEWHVLVREPRPLPAHVVQWRAEPRVIASLLGQAWTVATGDDALAWDALRLGRRVVSPAPRAPFDAWAPREVPAFDSRLAHTISPLLAQSVSFSRAVGGQGAPRRACMSPSFIREARHEAHRERRRPRVLAERALEQLRDDPWGALRTSRAWVIRTLASRARTPSQASRSSARRS